MFTGIIESLGIVTSIDLSGSNKTFWITSPISNQLKVDQSLSHNGVCLTVEEVKDGNHRVTAVKATLEVSNLNQWKTGNNINLERCLPMNGRLDGHIVQGHVDATGILVQKKNLQGSWELTFSFPREHSAFIIEKGSVSLNGISLTVFDVKTGSFSVAIIPYTYFNTNMQNMDEGEVVNLEFDMIGKYVVRIMNLK